jgi:DNA-binding CsgD family transcriptional regulator
MSSRPGLEIQPQSVTNVTERFDPLQVKALKAARVGLILLDRSLKPVYCNSEALKILAYPNRPTKATSAEFARSIRSIVGKNALVDDLVKTFSLTSGNRRYLGRIFMAGVGSEGRFKLTIAITLERERALLRELAARFQLTDRESEAVQHLSHGFTSKEIAQRMNISVNTVKAFFRFVMIKMGVTNRSGIIGKLVDGDLDN